MAKILKNENESPEVDLNKLTVKLAGMGLDDEIEDMIPGKKVKTEEQASDAVSAEDAQEDNSEEEVEEIEASDDSEEVEDAEIDEESDDVQAFYEKRAAERNLSVEKVEELAKEMDKLEEDPDAKKSKRPSSAKTTKEKKKVKLDAFVICSVCLAVIALAAGVLYLMKSLRKDPNLGMTLSELNIKYEETPIYRNNLEKIGFTLYLEPVLGNPGYRDYVSESAFPTGVEGEKDPTAVTTFVDKNEYYYFDFSSHCKVSGQAFDFLPPMYVTGQECKEQKLGQGDLKRIRFVMQYSDDSWSICSTMFSAYLQAFLPGTDSQTCLQKIESALSQSNASAEPAVIIKEGDIAYSVSLNDFQGISSFVMDIIPAEEASDYTFFNVILG